MKATLVSYLAGMSGDFLSFLIHRDPKFYSIADDIIPNNIKITEHNMWRFPNLLYPIGLEAKIYPNNRNWAVNHDSLGKLHEIYGDKEILLPSHWYGYINQYTTNGLFDRGVRLMVRDRHILKICYALWWIKSHTIANEIWPHRQEEIDEMIANNHPRKDLLLSILNSYHNWKFMSIRYNLLKDGQLDINTYIRRYFNEVYSGANHAKIKLNYLVVELDNLIYGDQSNLSQLDEYFGVNIDRAAVKAYADDNYNIIEKYLGVGVNSPEFNNDDVYVDAIINYAKDIVDARPNQFDYYNGKCNQ
jgi:hypothetical protein